MIHQHKFVTLDALRGIAAIAVILQHWYIFFLNSTPLSEVGAIRKSFPFYSVLFPFYNMGLYAVDLFLSVRVHLLLAICRADFK